MNSRAEMCRVNYWSGGILCLSTRESQGICLKDESSSGKNLFSDTDMRGGGKRLFLFVIINGEFVSLSKVVKSESFCRS